MKKLRGILTMLLLTALIAASDIGEAASIITIAPAGTAAYSITATGLQESAGIDLSVWYDAAALESPRVKSGSLTATAMMEANSSTPGIVRIVFITAGTIKGTGELASVTFTPKGTVTASSPKLSSNIYSISGSQLAVQSTSGTPQPDPGTGSAVRESKDTSAGAALGGSVVSGAKVASTTTASPTPTPTLTPSAPGTVSLPQELVRDVVRKEEPREEPAYVNEASNAGAAAGSGTPAVREQATTPAAPETNNSGSLSMFEKKQSVLDRFRTFKEIRSVKNLAALFDEGILHTTGIIQSPAIVVSDGTSLVTVAVELPHDTESPSFFLKGANLKSIRRISDRKWELDALPQKGKSDVRLSIILKGERSEISLVAVPPLNQVGTKLVALSVAALDALLAKPLKNGKPVYDINSDSTQDYLDDYILLAHWLLKQERSVTGVGRKPAAAGK